MRIGDGSRPPGGIPPAGARGAGGGAGGGDFAATLGALCGDGSSLGAAQRAAAASVGPAGLADWLAAGERAYGRVVSGARLPADGAAGIDGAAPLPPGLAAAETGAATGAAGPETGAPGLADALRELVPERSRLRAIVATLGGADGVTSEQRASVRDMLTTVDGLLAPRPGGSGPVIR